MWERTYKVLEEYIVEVMKRYQDELIRDNKIATGNLLNNINYVIEKNDTQIWVGLKLEDYWKYVEYGREPGKFPPVDKIREWISAKPILPNADSRGKLPTPEQLAYLVGRKIALEGIEAGTQLTRTLEEFNQLYEERIIQAVSDDLDKELDIILTEYLLR